MTGSLYQASDYATALSALLPRGPVWPKDPGSEQQLVLQALGAAPQRLDAAAQQLLVDAFPQTTISLLNEWEASLGLVSQNAGLTTAQRQAAIVAKLVEVGGQSAAYFIAYAASLGFAITIATYAPMRCGLNGCGDAVGGEDWCFAWSVKVVANTGAQTDAQLLAALQAVAPAETVVFLTS